MRQITSSHEEDGRLEGVRCIWAGSWLSICSSDGAGGRGREREHSAQKEKDERGWRKRERREDGLLKQVVQLGSHQQNRRWLEG